MMHHGVHAGVDGNGDFVPQEGNPRIIDSGEHERFIHKSAEN